MTHADGHTFALGGEQAMRAGAEHAVCAMAAAAVARQLLLLLLLR
jgi:hypothetical protein